MRRNFMFPLAKVSFVPEFPCATKCIFQQENSLAHVPLLLYNGHLPQHIQKPHQNLQPVASTVSTAMTGPHPLVEPRSFSSSTREVTFFNPALVPPSALTPGVTPFPDSKSPAFTSSGTRPWVVTPPPPTGLKTKLGEAGGASSSRGWFRNPSGRGPYSTALAFLLSGVLIVVTLGAYVLLVFLAITTQKPKYIAFSSCLGGLLLLIACNILSSGEPGGEVRAGGRARTESEGDEEVLRAYGLKR